jgi:hypothetical protein
MKDYIFKKFFIYSKKKIFRQPSYYLRVFIEEKLDSFLNEK